MGPCHILSCGAVTPPADLQASITQWGGSWYPLYVRPGNLDHEVWTSEKAAHLWALLPVHEPNPEEAGTTDALVTPLVGDLGRDARMDLENACLGLLTQQLEVATRHGVRVVEEGNHLCTLFVHAWGMFVDRAELAGCTGTSYTYLVELACGHCLVPRSLWVEPPWQPRAWWQARRRCRAQMLLLIDEDMTVNKLGGWGKATSLLVLRILEG